MAHIYDIWLGLVAQTRTAPFLSLLNEYGDARGVYDNAENVTSSDLPLQSARRRLLTTPLQKAEEISEFCDRYKIGIVSIKDEDYPRSLLSLKDPPIVLYYKGKLPDFKNRLCVGTVGTRRLSEYGAKMAYQTVYDLASAGAVIVSGLAKGIDGICHFAAFDSGGDTVAVIGCGFMHAYPKGHRDLMATLCREGCVISEFAPETTPMPENFPRRNRIISGLCDCIAVFEAPARSGALITASVAEDIGRNVFVLPGDADKSNYLASNRLIHDGASAFTSASDILAEYDAKYRFSYSCGDVTKKHFYSRQRNDKRIEELFEFESTLGGAYPSRKLDKKPSKKPKDTAEKQTVKEERPIDTGSMNELQKKIVDLLVADMTSDDISDSLGAPVSDVFTELTMLEIMGVATAKAGGKYGRVN